MNPLIANIFGYSLLAALLLVGLLICLVVKKTPWLNARDRRRHLRRVALENENVALVTYREKLRLKADAATSRYLLVCFGSDASHAAICEADDMPLGNSDDAPEAAEDPFTVWLFGLICQERIVIASEAISAGEDVYTAAGGKVQDEPAVAGTYWKVGTARQSASGNNDKLAIIPCKPVKLVVIAALTSTDGTAAGAADLAALKAEAEKIGDDVRAIGTACATATLVKVLPA